MKLSIKARLGIGFLLMLVNLLLAGAIANHYLSREADTFLKLKDEDKVFALTADSIAVRILNHRRYEKDLFLNIGSPAHQKEYLEKFGKEASAIKQDIQKLAGMARSGQALAAEIKDKAQGLLGKYSAYEQGFLELAGKVMQDAEMTPQAANQAMGPLKNAIRSLETDIVVLRETGVKMLDEVTEQSAREARAARNTVLGFLAAGIVLAILLAALTSRPITSALGRIISFAETVAAGEIEAKSQGKFFGELASLRASLEVMVGNLKKKIAEADAKSRQAAAEAEKARAAVAEAEEAGRRADLAKREGMLQAAQRLQDIVERVSAASEELSAQIEQSSHGTDEQTRQVAETATAMEEMNSTMLEVAKNASQAAESSDSARQKALSGSGKVLEVVTAIGAVQGKAGGLKDKMAELGKQAEGIGQILNVISDIADQTNLLALNAAIEAARAGDAGRGFAVVADEVRKLAEKTMQATQEVGRAIAGIQEGTRLSVASVEEAVAAIGTATGLANASGEALQGIVSLIETSADQVRSIATASEQQSAASEEVNRSIQEISRVSAETAQVMTQSAQAVGDLASRPRTCRG
jgi:methyl-accepting chemotaxis protein